MNQPDNSRGAAKFTPLGVSAAILAALVILGLVSVFLMPMF